MKFVIFVLVLALVRSCHGMASGMPVIACNSLFPEGHMTEAQDTPAP